MSLSMDEKHQRNRTLLLACLAENPDYQYIEELLKQGANPLGCVSDQSCSEDPVYCQIIDAYLDAYQSLDIDCDDFPKITALFLQYGMDVSRPEMPYEECDACHPMWMFGFYGGKPMLTALRLLLDYGLNAASAGEC